MPQAGGLTRGPAEKDWSPPLDEYVAAAAKLILDVSLISSNSMDLITPMSPLN
ncbi:hypothetical protein ABID16_004576 [Rhizobium aquaticum]|uniref:Uncharacterized protein n=1 Tax=Rhizobium aquaticum TaxID=1549636 RepID=A0ABV2J639_9HYPH